MFQHLSQEDKEHLNLIRDTDYSVILNSKVSSVPFLKYVFELHFKLFGETCSNCPNKITGYIKKLKNLKLEKMANSKTKERKFILHTDVIIPVSGTSEVYSNANLTDDIAKKLLKQNPNRKVLFSKIPDSFKVEVVKTPVVEEKTDDVDDFDKELAEQNKAE